MHMVIIHSTELLFMSFLVACMTCNWFAMSASVRVMPWLTTESTSLAVVTVVMLMMTWALSPVLVSVVISVVVSLVMGGRWVPSLVSVVSFRGSRQTHDAGLKLAAGIPSLPLVVL